MEENDAIYQLVIKYLNNETTEDESREVLRWIEDSAENQELFFRIKDVLDAIESKNAILQPAESIWEEKVLSRNSVANKKSNKIRKLIPGYIKYAAAIIISVSCAALYNYYTTPKQIVVNASTNQSATKIQLPDHSTVWLKPGSSISYNPNFNQVGRVVNLTGDAFFEVTKILDNTGHRKPFSIQTSKLKIRVLGTSFNVKNVFGQYGVVVRTGVVRVESTEHVVMLHPGDQVQLKGDQLIKNRVNADLYQGWITGEYKFNNTTIQEIKDLLETNSSCQVKIIQADNFKNICLSGRIMAPNEASLLNILSVMLKASIAKNNNTITIKATAYD